MSKDDGDEAFVVLHEIVETNGKTIKENNLARGHAYALGTLVEVKFDAWFGDGSCWKVHARLFVVDHTRDCDGTPLYTLSRWPAEVAMREPFVGQAHFGFGEHNLTPVDITPELLQGHGALEWPDGEGVWDTEG